MTAGMYLAVNTAVKQIAFSRHSRPMSVLPYQTALVMMGATCISAAWPLPRKPSLLVNRFPEHCRRQFVATAESLARLLHK